MRIWFLAFKAAIQRVTETMAAVHDAGGKMAGIESLDAMQRFGGKDVFRKVALEYPALHA